MLKAVAPDWTELVMAEKYSAAYQQLQTAKRLSSHNPAARPLLDSMQWVTDIEQLVTERGGPTAPISVFERSDKINALLAWWEENPDGRHRALGTIIREVPEFAELRARVFSHQRTLQSHKALEFVAISRLRETLDEKLRSGQAEDLGAVLSDFEKRYPHIVGSTQLETDLQHYLPIEEQIKARDWLRASNSLSAASFKTPLFRARAAYISANLLPSGDILDKYRQASAAWHDGQFDGATRLLKEVSATRWPEPAQRQLQRQARLRGEYARLQSVRGTADYEDQLLSFYAQLEPNQDAFFIDQLKGDFEAHRERALARAQQAFQRADDRWRRYRDNGGIQGLQRLETGVSATFRTLAKVLSEAYRDAGYGTRVYSLLGTECPRQWEELYGQISNEVGLQRRSLAELSLVLEPSLKRDKLRLLPALQVDASGANPTTTASEHSATEVTDTTH